ncbi:MAG: sigma-54-dependent Fis family transcriptional regulator, partial [Candidatus Riflebacteria bacterium]|nr:sigma-54-dependent Fis family transcriptional regulator [Candidatus Riflebacteria bacterium]
FLDEIGDISQAVQVKLLRFLQEKEFKRLGHAKISKADVRIIAATNKDLREAVKANRFREDLYYRLNIIPITLPPLRSRREDIPPLANHFLRRFAARYDRAVQSISEKAMLKLLSYPWPGNVRELENKIQQVLVLTGHRVVQPEDFSFDDEPTSIDPADKKFNEAKREVVEAFERNYISTLLTTHRGNVSRAARQAGKNRRAFFELMRKHRIDADTFRNAGQA